MRLCVKSKREWWWEGVGIVTGRVEALEAIIKAADPTTRCARAGKIGPPGEGSQTPPEP